MWTICNCTLAGTKACDNCNNNTGSLTVSSQWFTDWNTDWFKEAEKLLNRPVEKLQLIDLTKYDIVEKKDAKIARLEQSLEASKRQKENNRTLINKSLEEISVFNQNIDECDGDIEELEKEIEQLKKS